MKKLLLPIISLFIAIASTAHAVDFPAVAPTAFPAAAAPFPAATAFPTSTSLPGATSFPGAVAATTEDYSLAAAGFPESKYDYSFTDRMDAMRKGYEPFETVFDADGNCISGCAYPGMTLQSEIDYYQTQTDMAVERARVLCDAGPECVARRDAAKITPEEEKTLPPQKIEVIQAQQSQWTGGYCPVASPSRSVIPASQMIPYGYPLNVQGRLTSGFGPRSSTTGSMGKPISTFHYGYDIAVPTGTPVFSTVSGTVNFAGNAGVCGYEVRIDNEQGFGAKFCHLSKIMVNVGDKVSGGCIVGLSGNTGNTTGPHLHYEVRKDGHAVNPKTFM